jgi:hypothetical protein
MSNINAAFMAVPPIEEKIVDENGKLTDIWKNHFDAISQTLGLVVVHDRFNNTKQETPVTVVIAMEQVDRDQLDNAIDGTILYNRTTNRFNFREAGTWVTFTPVAA